MSPISANSVHHFLTLTLSSQENTHTLVCAKALPLPITRTNTLWCATVIWYSDSV